jgi:hypothetical protein
MRFALLSVFAVSGLTDPVFAGIAAPPPSATAKFASSEVVVTGKVTAIEKDPVTAIAPYAGAKEKVAYRVAVVKIESALAGANGQTHIKVGFVPPDPSAPPDRGSGGVIRPREPVPELKEGQTVLLYLSKHPTEGFYVMPSRFMPADLGTAAGGQELADAKKFAEALADPLKGLKSDKPEVRAETAALLVTKYGAYPAIGTTVEPVPIDAAESALILKCLAEADWRAGLNGAPPAAASALYQLRLTEKDGWKQPVVKPGEDGFAKTKEAFVKWLDGPGKDYRIKKLVPKK